MIEENLLINAISLRKNMTPEEKHLWYDFLSKYPIRFYKQRIINHYIVDFYCFKAKLVIELDGAQHYEAKAIEYDNVRTQKLQQYELEVIRFTNKEVKDNFQEVCQEKAALI